MLATGLESVCIQDCACCVQHPAHVFHQLLSCRAISHICVLLSVGMCTITASMSTCLLQLMSADANATQCLQEAARISEASQAC